MLHVASMLKLHAYICNNCLAYGCKQSDCLASTFFFQDLCLMECQETLNPHPSAEVKTALLKLG